MAFRGPCHVYWSHEAVQHLLEEHLGALEELGKQQRGAAGLVFDAVVQEMEALGYRYTEVRRGAG